MPARNPEQNLWHAAHGFLGGHELGGTQHDPEEVHAASIKHALPVADATSTAVLKAKRLLVVRAEQNECLDSALGACSAQDDPTSTLSQDRYVAIITIDIMTPNRSLSQRQRTCRS